jgi:hypothetical protein
MRRVPQKTLITTQQAVLGFFGYSQLTEQDVKNG